MQSEEPGPRAALSAHSAAVAPRPQVHELFERRKDKLKERRALPQQDTVVVSGRNCFALHSH